MKKKNIVILLSITLVLLGGIYGISTIAKTSSKSKISQETYNKIMEKASNPCYDEKNAEYMKKQLDILQNENLTEEEKNKEYKAIKDEMYEYSNNKKKTKVSSNNYMTREELEKKLNDFEVSYEILEKMATTKEKLQHYTNIKNQIIDLQKQLDNADLERQNQIQIKYNELRKNLGLED